MINTVMIVGRVRGNPQFRTDMLGIEDIPVAVFYVSREETTRDCNKYENVFKCIATHAKAQIYRWWIEDGTVKDGTWLYVSGKLDKRDGETVINVNDFGLPSRLYREKTDD